MSTINIDGKEYDIEALGGDVRAQILSLRFADTELVRLKALTAVVQTARDSYARALKTELSESEISEVQSASFEGLGETIQFNE